MLSDNMGNTNVQGLSSGECHMVSQQGWLLHDSTVLAAVRVATPDQWKETEQMPKTLRNQDQIGTKST